MRQLKHAVLEASSSSSNSYADCQPPTIRLAKLRPLINIGSTQFCIGNKSAKRKEEFKEFTN